MTSRGMVQVSGTTYRIVEATGFHEIVRVSDDCRIGAFRHHPTLEIVDSLIDRELLRDVARAALRSARLVHRKTRERRSIQEYLYKMFLHVADFHQLRLLPAWARAWLN